MRATKAWPIWLAALLVTSGCGQPPSAPQKADGQATSQQAGASEPQAAAPLTPGDEAIADLDTAEKRAGKGIPESALILDLGGTVRTYAATLPFALVEEQGESVVLLGGEKGKLWVSAKLSDAAGKTIGEIEKNQLVRGDANSLRIEQTPHALSVYEDGKKGDGAQDGSARRLLAVRFLNLGAVRVFSDFHSPRGVEVVIDEQGVQFGHDRTLANTGMNGTGLVLDPPAAKLAAAEKMSKLDGKADTPPAGDDATADAAAPSGDVGEAMTAAAQAFLAALTPEEKAKAAMKFDDPARLDWTNIPKAERKGLPIRDMNEGERKLCHALLRAALSPAGYAKAVKIMSLENNLREGEKNLNTGWDRDPGRYYLTIFGEPAATGTWGWSIEGHHLSLNFVLRDGAVVSETPSFWGANPATVLVYVPGGPEQGTRTLGAEEQLAFDLVGSLS
ncbi:MAG TPA: DUF3500 domain-containing protein, partial [Pirellulales bacterium]|nr:DUF3500 domain-containing protein [Pirellulales bacterium]